MTTSSVAPPQQGLHRAVSTDGRRPVPEWVDRLLGSDPGLARLLFAAQAVATIGAAMAAEWFFVRTTHALQLTVLPGATAAQAALVAAQHHGVTVIAILVGAIIGMMASFTAAMFSTPLAQLKFFALTPIPMIAGIAVGLVLAPNRVLSLASFVVVLGGGAYCRRFGPLGFAGGALVFIGDFLGFFLHVQLGLGDLGWLAAEVVIGAIVAAIAHFTVFYPSRRAALRRMRRSYAIRAREVAAAAVDVLDHSISPERASRRLQRRLIRLNETALMIDAQLGNPAAVPDGMSATALHQRLFDAELALTNLVRFAERLNQSAMAPATMLLVRQALSAVARFDLTGAELIGHDLLDQLAAGQREQSAGTSDHADGPDADATAQIVAHRFAVSVIGFSAALSAPLEGPSDSPDDEADRLTDGAPSAEFTPMVALLGGWLPGSAMVSAAASMEQTPADRTSGSRWGRARIGVGIGLAPYTRVAIQMTVAITAAVVFGNLLSERRFYWAVIAAFVTFMGANNEGEQLRKGMYRVLGTVVGVLVGATLAHLVGQRTDLAITVILVSLFFGFYLFRISYAFMVLGITVMVSQLYVQLDEFSNSLLLLRLEETALGVAVAALTVMLVVPLRTRRVARVATRQYLEALSDLSARAVQRMLDGAVVPAATLELRAAARRLDGAYQSLITTLTPLRLSVVRADTVRREQSLQSLAASRHYARNLLVDTANPRPLDASAHAGLQRAGEQLSSSLAAVVSTLQSESGAELTYVRASALFDVVATGTTRGSFTDPWQLALRDLQLIDGAMATFASRAGMSVRALDADVTA